MDRKPGDASNGNAYGERLRSEIEHGRHIAKNAEAIWYREGPINQHRLDRRFEFLCRGLGPGLKCLEVGCGTGILTARLAQTGAAVTAIELSPDLLKLAQHNVAQAHFIEGDACDTGLPEGSFDAVRGTSSLHHLDWKRGLREFFRVLKPGGTLAFTEPNYLNPHVFLERKITFLKHRLGVSDHETAFVRWPLKREMERTGFRDIRLVPFDFVYPFFPAASLGAMKRIGGVLEAIPLIREVAGSLEIWGVK